MQLKLGAGTKMGPENAPKMREKDPREPIGFCYLNPSQYGPKALAHGLGCAMLEIAAHEGQRVRRMGCRDLCREFWEQT